MESVGPHRRFGRIAGLLVARLRSRIDFRLDPVGFVDDDRHRLGHESIPRLDGVSFEVSESAPVRGCRAARRRVGGDLRPALTGPWQISGRSDTTLEETVRFACTYLAGWSLARDSEILFATVPAVLSGRGTY